MRNRGDPGQYAAAALLLTAASALALPAPAEAQRAGALVRSARADFADMAAGTYLGELAPGGGGASRPGIRLTVAKVGPNRVRITSDPARLPAFTVQLIRSADMLRDSGGGETFQLDLSKSPRTLKLRVGDASWAGVRQ